MLTGSVVFDREGDLEKLWAHVHDPPRRLVALNPELPPGLQDVLDRALAKLGRPPAVRDTAGAGRNRGARARLTAGSS